MKITRSVFQSVTVIGLVAVACWNVADYTATMLFFRNSKTNVEGAEELWVPLREHLNAIGYRIGDLGFVSSSSLRDGTMTEEDKLHRAYLYYAAIPFNVVENKLDAPYIIGDFLRSRPDTLPPGLVMVFDPGNGLVLLKSTRDK
jgi:hypothetical protein